MFDQQEIQFQAQPAGRDFRGEVIDSKTFETIARTSLTYPTAHMAEVGARRMWQNRVQRIATTMNGRPPSLVFALLAATTVMGVLGRAVGLV
ncbi:MAG: hypothetical protein GAK28_00595 [Luteibacter sp.]|uniref:hypothetical protein n=1 Tax=Luteibacter sp. TaxID=1886636 RepID=UPI00137F0B1C|nr:hypothetical protein [Luteibacter sp.]KAF1008963.1 MAG: hypothetical protein GAK28_00595 [Luteibacter sp.]